LGEVACAESEEHENHETSGVKRGEQAEMKASFFKVTFRDNQR